MAEKAKPTRDELRKAAEASKAEKKKKAKRKAERDAPAFPGAHRGY